MVPISLLATALLILGPGAFAPAAPLALERVEVRRVWNGWGLDSFAPIGYVRIAIDDCDYLGHYCTIVTGGTCYPCRVVDCLNKQHTTLEELGIVADVSLAEIGHETGMVVLWKEDISLKSESRKPKRTGGNYRSGADGYECTLSEVIGREKLR